MDRVKIDEHEIVFTVHSIDRYIERVKPGLTRSQALNDLLKMVPYASIDEAPEWAEQCRAGLLATSVDVWLYYGSDVAFPILNGSAITCISKGGLSETTRVKRNFSRSRMLKRGKLPV